MWEWLTRSITCFPAKYKSLLQISHTWPIFSKTSQARAAIVVLERRVSDHSVISRPVLFYLSFWEVSTDFILSLLLRDLDRFYFISPFWEVSTDFILSLLLRGLDRFYFISPFERSRPILFYLSFWEVSTDFISPFEIHENSERDGESPFVCLRSFPSSVTCIWFVSCLFNLTVDCFMCLVSSLYM